MNDMNDTFAPYDSADYIRNEEDALNFLNATLELNDSPESIANALSVVARARAKNFSQLAREVNISREGLYNVLSKDGNPTLSTFMGLLKALGLQLSFQSATKRAAES